MASNGHLPEVPSAPTRDTSVLGPSLAPNKFNGGSSSISEFEVAEILLSLRQQTSDRLDTSSGDLKLSRSGTSNESGENSHGNCQRADSLNQQATEITNHNLLYDEKGIWYRCL